MLFKSRLFRLLVIFVYCLVFLYWQASQISSPDVSTILSIMFLIVPVLNLYQELSLAKRNTTVYIINCSYYDLLIYFLILVAIIALTNTFSKSQISFIILSVLTGLYSKTRKELIFLEEGGYLRKGIFTLKKVNYSDLTEVSRENNILSFTSSNNLFQIDLSKMENKEKDNFLKELKTHIQVKEFA